MADIANIVDGENVGIAFGKLNEVINRSNSIPEMITTNKNLQNANQSGMRKGFRVSSSAGTSLIASTDAFCVTQSIQLKHNVDYVLSGNAIAWGASPRGVFFEDANSTTGGDNVTFTAITGGFKIKATNASKLYFCLDLVVSQVGGDIVVGDVQLEEGLAVTDYVISGYRFLTDKKDNNELLDILEKSNKLTSNIINSKNLQDSRLTAIRSGKRISSQKSKLVSAADAAIAATEPILLESGKTYALSGSAIAWGASPRAFWSTESSDVGTPVVFTQVTGGFTLVANQPTELYIRLCLITTEIEGGGGEGAVQLEAVSLVTD